MDDDASIRRCSDTTVSFSFFLFNGSSDLAAPAGNVRRSVRPVHDPGTEKERPKFISNGPGSFQEKEPAPRSGGLKFRPMSCGFVFVVLLFRSSYDTLDLCPGANPAHNSDPINFVSFPEVGRPPRFRSSSAQQIQSLGKRTVAAGDTSCFVYIILST
ncbi:hypothetical protein GWI33_014781 [Rhynchophorus ferrugineus]|uniref:Uncharacterized protein n=1 Tax=Rhynchophorus ferrugineus TaxID=354439 RepID=A0A834I0W6_RHYFE|nr:hypothetical protein GWI33_014781 [Rhynchophorus ferrugineus]